jgi:hypothetical protein
MALSHKKVIALQILRHFHAGKLGSRQIVNYPLNYLGMLFFAQSLKTA